MYNNTTIILLAMVIVNGRSTFIWQINYSISADQVKPIYNVSMPFYCQTMRQTDRQNRQTNTFIETRVINDIMPFYCEGVMNHT